LRKILSVITVMLFLVVLVACGKQDYSNPSLITLEYYDYLDDNNPVITIDVKDIGIMEVQLFPDVAPLTVANIVSYIEDEAYSNSSFHRVIYDFMIQGGIVENNKAPIEGEFIANGINNPLKHTRGVISMARTNVPNSATSQFYIVHKASHWLDGQYAGFGGLISGFEVLDTIAKVETNNSDAPTSEIVIKSITIELNGYKK